MRLEDVTAEIRPRSDWEAVDLGLALVRRDFWRCLSVWWLAVIVPTAATGWWLWDSPGLWLLLFWWWKPAASRMVLFELSRRLFGERPSWSSTMREIPRAWGRRFFYRYICARLSPWLPVTLAVEDLERLRGNAYRLRCGQVTRRGQSVTMWLYLIGDMAACWVGLAILVLVLGFVPDGQDGAWQMAVESWDPAQPHHIPALILRTVVFCVMAAYSLTDLFVTGAGFGIYLNNRTWIEGWDVELAFKRLSQRLTGGGLALALAVGLIGFSQGAKAADHSEDPARIIREVKTAPEFKVHTFKEKRLVPWTLPEWLDDFHLPAGSGSVMFYLLLGTALWLAGWLLWKFRHVFVRRDGFATSALNPGVARVVMGMAICPESLPADVPDAAWELWRRGHEFEALALLYRGTISRVVERAGVEIIESDTEGECLRRVFAAGPVAYPDYFHVLTHVWMGMAYARERPADEEVESLCRKWPFEQRRLS